MSKRGFGAVAAVLALIPAAAAAADRSRTVFATTGQVGPGWFICDVLNAPAVVLVGRPGPDRLASIGVLLKSPPGARPVVKMYGVAAPRGGAGQLRYALRRGGEEAGKLEAFNAAASSDPAQVLTPSFTGMALGTADYRCRWLARTRMIGIGTRGSFVIRDDRGGLVFEAFDYGPSLPILRPGGAQQTTRPSRRVTGGREEAAANGGTVLRFAGRGRNYVVTVPPGPRAQATLAIEQRGKPLVREPLLAFTFAPR